MPITIETAIDIDAPQDKVWAILSDTANWPRWNPFAKVLEGTIAVGNRLKIEVTPVGRAPMQFKPVVVELTSGTSFAWLGSLPIPGLFNGRHAYRLEALSPGRTRFHHGEVFTGLIAGLVMGSGKGATEKGFIAMNEALKREAEKN
jgi:hypothetical protein